MMDVKYLGSADVVLTSQSGLGDGLGSSCIFARRFLDSDGDRCGCSGSTAAGTSGSVVGEDVKPAYSSNQKSDRV